jgi:amidase
MDPFHSAAALQRHLERRDLSAVEALTACVARIEAHDPAINAIPVSDLDRAFQQAKAADAARAAGRSGALLGLPITVKESFRVAGLPCTWGNTDAPDASACTTAVAVQRLLDAGAVLIGKSNVSHNLGDWQTDNPRYGRCNNPWDLARTPGGSSGGAAAALAAGFCALELGSDLGGSLRVPAHFCGVYAHKPTHGIVPTRGHAPPGAPDLAFHIETDLAVAGPMARSAADLALALDVLAGPDAALATAYRFQLPPPRARKLSDFRVLVLSEHPRLAMANELAQSLDAFAQRLATLGCQVSTSAAALPSLALIDDTFTWLMKAFLGAQLPDKLYARLRDRRADDRPTAPNTPEVPLDQRALVASHRDWIRAHQRRVYLTDHWLRFFQAWDVVVCPVMPTAAFPHDASDWSTRRIDIDGQSHDYARQGVWAGLASLSGLPATSFPIGLGADSGLPLGVQAIGPYLEDRTPLAFAAACEEAFGGFVAPDLA